MKGKQQGDCTLVAQKPSVFPAKDRPRLRMEPYTARRSVVPSTHRTTCAGVALRASQLCAAPCMYPCTCSESHALK